MRIGTPGFVGERLRQARLAVKLTQTQLAELLDKKPNTISAYESERITPTEDVLVELSRLLGQPLEFFRRPVLKELHDNAIFYRSVSAATKAARDKAEVRLKWLREITTFVVDQMEFPEVNFKEYPGLPKNPELMSFEMIEEVAEWVREQWKIGERPIANLVRTAEANGAIIAIEHLDAIQLDALSEWGEPEGIPYIILNADKEASVRTRFDLAHELGHLFLHRHIKPDEVKGPLFKLLEDQAFYFAGALLLPRKAFSADLYAISLDVMLSLKPKWRVSIAAMISRARNLNLITEEGYQNLWKLYIGRRYKKKEPYDKEWVLEEPTLLKQAMEMLVEENVLHNYEMESTIGIGRRYIQSLCYLSDDYFSSPSVALKVIKFA